MSTRPDRGGTVQPLFCLKLTNPNISPDKLNDTRNAEADQLWQMAALGDQEILLLTLLEQEFLPPSSLVSTSDSRGGPEMDTLGGIISTKVLAGVLPFLSNMKDQLAIEVSTSRKRKLDQLKTRGPAPVRRIWGEGKSQVKWPKTIDIDLISRHGIDPLWE